MLALAQPREEAVGAVDGVLLGHEHAVHVHEPAADLAARHRADRSLGARDPTGARMELVAAYPIVVTDSFRECRDFHARWFGLEVGFEADWIAVLTGGGSASRRSRSCTAGIRPRRRRRSPTTATAMFLTLQVADAAAEYERLAGRRGCASTSS